MPDGSKGGHALPPGVYRHYKGGLYRVHAIGYIHETLEPVVVYESLQDAGDFPSGTFFTRPYFQFTETIMLKDTGEEVERFTYQSDYDHWIL